VTDRAHVSISLDSPTDTPYLSPNNLEYHCFKPSLRLDNPCLTFSCAFTWTREFDPGFEGFQQLDAVVYHRAVFNVVNVQASSPGVILPMSISEG
jgi:hypothetical protein